MPTTPARMHVWLALWAALAQLWLGTLHAGIDASGYCGDGSAGRSAALLRQLPPELRLPLDRLDATPAPDCAQCALACAAVLPGTSHVAVLPRPAPAARQPQLPVPASAPRPQPPPARGPPATT